MYSTRISRTFVIAVAALLNISRVNAVCMLCEDGVDGLQFPYAVVKSDGTTCSQMAIDFATDYEEGSSTCSKKTQAWRQICCGDDEPIDVEVTDVFDEYPDIDSIETVGPYEKCNICRDGDYPSASSMVITMLYIGSGSCPQYWKAGQQGLIPDHLCDPLQYFAYEPCGCGEYSTNGNYDWGESSSSSSSSSSSTTTTTSNDDDDGWWGGADSGSSSSTPTDGDDNSNWYSNWWGGANSLPSATDTDDAPWWGNADSSAETPSLRSGILVSLMLAMTTWIL